MISTINHPVSNAKTGTGFAGAPGTAGSAGPLERRCLSLGLASYAITSERRPTLTTTHDEVTASWLRSTLLLQKLASIASLWAHDESPKPTTLFPGCHLIPVILRRGHRRVGISLALALGDEAPHAPAFADISEAASLPLPVAVAAVQPLLGHSQAELGRLAQVLQWSEHDLNQAHTDRQALSLFTDKLTQAYEETSLLFRLARLMNNSTRPDELMQTTCNQMLPVLPFAWLAVRFNKTGVEVPELTGKLLLAGDLPCSREQFDLQAEQYLTHLKSDDWTRLLNPNRHELARLVNSEVIADPVTHGGKVIGVLMGGNKRGPDHEVSTAESQLLDAAADLLGVFHENIARFLEQHKLFMGTVRALSSAIDAKDSYTRGHSERVSLMAANLALAAGMPTKEVEMIRIAGLMHDVGKIGVPEAVLCKRGRLTAEEFDQMKRHPVIGYEILKDIPPLTPALGGILHHHERWDGRGYPHGLSGENIPLMGRILALADSFDAMSSDRSYRPALPREGVLEEIKRCTGAQFDPRLAPIFLTLNLHEFDEMIVRHRGQTTQEL